MRSVFQQWIADLRTQSFNREYRSPSAYKSGFEQPLTPVSVVDDGPLWTRVSSLYQADAGTTWDFALPSSVVNDWLAAPAKGIQIMNLSNTDPLYVCIIPHEGQRQLQTDLYSTVDKVVTPNDYAGKTLNATITVTGDDFLAHRTHVVPASETADFFVGNLCALVISPVPNHPYAARLIG